MPWTNPNTFPCLILSLEALELREITRGLDWIAWRIFGCICQKWKRNRERVEDVVQVVCWNEQGWSMRNEEGISWGLGRVLSPPWVHGTREKERGVKMPVGSHGERERTSVLEMRVERCSIFHGGRERSDLGMTKRKDVHGKRDEMCWGDDDPIGSRRERGGIDSCVKKREKNVWMSWVVALDT